MKRIITIFTLMTLTITALFLANQTLLLARSSVSASDAMLTANQLYESGQFDQAAQAYQQLVDRGVAGSALYYNLGNAYFKQGDYGRAILNYRRAGLLAPRDADIQANLDLARTQVVDQLEETGVSEGFFSTLGRWTQKWLTLDELALAVLSVWVLFTFLLIIFSNARQGGALHEGLQYVLIVNILVLTVGIVGLGSRMHVDDSRPEAVIVAPEVNVTSGPGAQYVTEFTLHNGAEVRLLETRGNWSRLALAGDEWQGWVPAGTVEAVNQVAPKK